MTHPSDHPLDHLEAVTDLVARGRRWVVRGPEVVLCVDLLQGGSLEITPRGADRFDVVLAGQDTTAVERLLVGFTATRTTDARAMSGAGR